ncbi:MAG: hypothetical protein GY822_25205 [Deltaproteobacteria bacterium]|nr:hypothetical protein [Deltaproteobacteria bacterium]
MSALLDDNTGFSALHELVGGQTRQALVSEGAAALLSSDFFAQYAADIDGPIFEVSWPSQTVLEGVLRACKHRDALLVVELPAFLYERDVGRVHREVASLVLDAIDKTDFERPLTLLSSGWSLDELCKSPVEEQVFRLFAAVEAGFCAFRFEVPEEPLDPAAVEEVFDALSAWGVGAELVCDDGENCLELEKNLSDHGRTLACTEGIELSGMKNVAFSPLVVVDPMVDKLSKGTSRLRIDSVVLASVKRALRDEGAGLAERAEEFGASRVLASISAAMDDIDDDTKDRLKAFSYADLRAFSDACGASGKASAFLDAVLSQYELER